MRRRMKNFTYLELYKREPKIARLLLINHYFKPHSITKMLRNLKLQEILSVKHSEDIREEERKRSMIAQNVPTLSINGISKSKKKKSSVNKWVNYYEWNKI